MTLTLRILPPCAFLALASKAVRHPETDAFVQYAFVDAPEIVDCAVEDGTETQYHQITVGYMPDGLETGPFCTAALEDAGSVWGWTG